MKARLLVSLPIWALACTSLGQFDMGSVGTAPGIGVPPNLHARVAEYANWVKRGDPAYLSALLWEIRNHRGASQKAEAAFIALADRIRARGENMPTPESRVIRSYAPWLAEIAHAPQRVPLSVRREFLRRLLAIEQPDFPLPEDYAAPELWVCGTGMMGFGWNPLGDLMKADAAYVGSLLDTPHFRHKGAIMNHAFFHLREIVRPRLGALTKDYSPSVRAAAVGLIALSSMNGAAEFTQAFAMAADDSHAFVRQAVAGQLNFLPEGRRKAVREKLANDPVARVRDSLPKG